MRALRWVLGGLMGLAMVASAGIPGMAEGEVKAGAAAVKITPPLGVPMAGYYSPRFATAVHDDLYARALVLDSGGERAALVTLDLISTTRELVEDARRRVAAATGIRGEAVMISATHAHTGPVLYASSRRYSALGEHREAVRKYSEEVAGRIAEAVKQADGARVPARLSAAVAREEGISFNRRFHMKDGSVGWNPGKRNPNIVRPAGGIDPDVHVLYVESAGPNPKPIATYVNFALHPDTVGGTAISADYPGVLSDLLARFKGPEMVTLFANGCCGDINHLDVNWDHPQKGPGEAARIGTQLAAAVLRGYRDLRPLAPGPLRIRGDRVALPLPALQPGAVERAEKLAEQAAGPTPPPFMAQVEAFRVLDVAARGGRPLDAEVQVIQLGPEAAWVSLPGEIFVSLGLAIKRGSPFRYTMIAELANGSLGYIPDRPAYPQGNYEVVSARCAEGSGELLVDSALRQLRALYRAAE